MADIRKFEPLWGEWRSVRLLGQGACAKVYLMEKLEQDKQYYTAIKYISLPSAPSDSEALYATGRVGENDTLKDYYQRVLDRLITDINMHYWFKGNPNIVSYEGHRVIPREGELGFDIFVKMELLTNLKEYVSNNAVTVLDVVKLGEDICAALALLMTEKMVHRGIKPGNIFVSDTGDYKLGDFGVAQTLEMAAATEPDKASLAYIAPELARGEAGDNRGDIYSLGLILYQLMNHNRGPFLSTVAKRVTQKMNNQAQTRRLQGEEMLPPAMADETLSTIILKACAYNPNDRWESAEKLQGALYSYRRRKLSLEAAGKVVLEGTPVDNGAKPDSASVSTALAADTVNNEKELPAETVEPTSTQDKGEQVNQPQEQKTLHPHREAEAVQLPDDDVRVFVQGEIRPVLRPTAEVSSIIPERKAAPQKKKWVPILVALSIVTAAVILVAVLFDTWGGAQEDYVDTIDSAPAVLTSGPGQALGPAQVSTPAVTPELQPTADTTELPAELPTELPTELPAELPAEQPTVQPTVQPSPTQTTPKPTPKPTTSKVPVKSITLSRSSLLMEVGGTFTLAAQISPANATVQTVTWSSSNSSVAKAGSNGSISAVGIGTTIITASCGGFTATCAVSIS